jgi:hypothetical protein
MKKMTNKQWDKWSKNHVYTKVVFWWRDGECEYTIRNSTFDAALKNAEQWGFREPKWYNPKTWGNSVITVG